MIEVRKTTDKEKAKHSNIDYVIDLGHTKQWFTEKALVELLGKVQNVVNENDLLQHVSPRYYYVATKVNKNEIRLISGGFSKKDAIEYKQFIIQKYPTAFIIADFNEG